MIEKISKQDSFKTDFVFYYSHSVLILRLQIFPKANIESAERVVEVHIFNTGLYCSAPTR